MDYELTGAECDLLDLFVPIAARQPLQQAVETILADRRTTALAHIDARIAQEQRDYERCGSPGAAQMINAHLSELRDIRVFIAAGVDRG